MIGNVINSARSRVQALIPLQLREMSAQLQALTSRVTAAAACLIESSLSLGNDFSFLERIDRYVSFDALSASVALTILDKFSLEELKDVLLSAQSFLCNERNIFSRAAIISAVAIPSITQRQNVLAYARPLVTETMTNEDKSWLIRSIAAQDSARRGYFLASTFFTLITEEMPDPEKLVMEQAIDLIAVEERGEVFAYTQILISNRMNGFERKAILTAIDAISSEERIEVLSFTRALVTDSMMGYEKEQVIRAITAIYSGDRREVFSCVQAFITETMSGFAISDMVAIVGRLSSEERIRVQVIAEDGDDFIRAEIMGRLRQRQRPRLQNFWAYQTLARQFPRKTTAVKSCVLPKKQNTI